MRLTAKTSVNELAERYPFLIDFLASYNPRLGPLKVKSLRMTLGRMATLGHAARMAGVPLRDLMEAVCEAIGEHAGETVEVALGEYGDPGARKRALDTGAVAPQQLNAILKTLPVDLSFVDENDVVCYYNDTRERVFPRSPGVIGRKVQNCHPPASVSVVNRILDAFKSGEKDEAEFWLQIKGKFIHIVYRAVRDRAGKYLGTMEVAQDVTRIRALTGERRLLSWDQDPAGGAKPPQV